MRKTHNSAKNSSTRRRQAQRHNAQGRRRKELNNLAVIPLAVETGSNMASESGSVAEIPVALNSRPGSADSAPVTTAEIPVAVATGNGNAAKGKRQPRGTKAKVMAIPVAFKARSRSGDGRAGRSNNRPQVPKRHLPKEQENQYSRFEAPVKPADPITRAAVSATYIEESAVDLAGRFGLASIGTFETMFRLLMRMPAISDAKTLGRVLRWKAVREAPPAWAGETETAPPLAA